MWQGKAAAKIAFTHKFNIDCVLGLWVIISEGEYIVSVLVPVFWKDKIAFWVVLLTACAFEVVGEESSVDKKEELKFWVFGFGT